MFSHNLERDVIVKVLVYSAFYLPGYKGGGPIKTIANLVATTSNEIAYDIVTRDRDLGDKTPYTEVKPNCWTTLEGVNIFYATPNLQGLVYAWIQALRSDYDVVYLNSFFSPSFSFVPLLLAKIRKKKVILGPRGEFSPGALRLKKSKKRMFIRVFKALFLDRGTIFQASTEFEAQEIKKTIGEKVEIFVAEDIGLYPEQISITPKNADFLKLVFVSRISPKKNLSYALETLKGLRCNVTFDIFGPVEDQEHWAQCVKIIDSLPKHVKVNYRGELFPRDVLKALSRYDLFFLPTSGENYGHVIAEALSAGLPVLIADTTPWRNLKKDGIGWDLPLNRMELFSEAIEEAAAMSADTYSAFRHNVMNWAKNKFSQTDAIDANKRMFRHALERSEI